MFKFKGSFEKLELSVKRATAGIKRAIENEVREAARAFLRAAYPNVPVLTGMARGALLPAAEALGVNVPINPIAQRRGRNPESGAALSTFDFIANGSSFIVKVGVGVKHYQLNEFTAGHAPTAPWQSFKAGRVAYRDYLRARLARRIPKIFSFVTRTRVVTRG